MGHPYFLSDCQSICPIYQFIVVTKNCWVCCWHSFIWWYINVWLIFLLTCFYISLSFIIIICFQCYFCWLHWTKSLNLYFSSLGIFKQYFLLTSFCINLSITPNYLLPMLFWWLNQKLFISYSRPMILGRQYFSKLMLSLILGI